MIRVLIADDSESNRELLRTMLEHLGHEVTEAGDGELAIAAARTAKPDLVIADIRMPRLDGYGLLAQMRADPALATMPVIALTAHAMDGDRDRGIHAGFREYLTKPLTLRTLRAVLERVLG